MTPARPAGRLSGRLVAAGLVVALLFAGFVALGIWQVARLHWKLALIAQVDARLHAAPVPAPGPAGWATISKADAYRRVSATGSYLPQSDTLVQAATDRGAGWWVLTPLRTRDFTLLINRGFVPTRDAPRAVPATPVTVTGLLRVTEPGGGFLRSNDPIHDRWYSRDVAAITATRHLGTIAPYFVDANAASGAPGGPVGGLTVVSFPNNHLVYAITWFALALMSAGGGGYWVREAWRRGPREPRIAR